MIDLFLLENAKINYDGQGLVYIKEPDSFKKNAVAVIAVHGSGRGAKDYTETEFYKKQCDIAIENGCLFAVVSNVRDTWGTDDGVYNINLLTDYIIKNYPVKNKVVLWCTSAGGVTANRMVKAYPEKILAVIGTFPVFDLISGFSLDSCKKAWNCFDLNDFKRLTDGKTLRSFLISLKALRILLHTVTATVPFLFQKIQKNSKVKQAATYF